MRRGKILVNSLPLANILPTNTYLPQLVNPNSPNISPPILGDNSDKPICQYFPPPHNGIKIVQQLMHLYCNHNCEDYCITLLSLSTVVLNSRDREEIIWLREFSYFIKQPCNRFYPKKCLECITKAVPWAKRSDKPNILTYNQL